MQCYNTQWSEESYISCFLSWNVSRQCESIPILSGCILNKPNILPKASFWSPFHYISYVFKLFVNDGFFYINGAENEVIYFMFLHKSLHKPPALLRPLTLFSSFLSFLLYRYLKCLEQGKSMNEFVWVCVHVCGQVGWVWQECSCTQYVLYLFQFCSCDPRIMAYPTCWQPTQCHNY